jgi:hypothetical protein
VQFSGMRRKWEPSSARWPASVVFLSGEPNLARELQNRFSWEKESDKAGGFRSSSRYVRMSSSTCGHVGTRLAGRCACGHHGRQIQSPNVNL